MLKLDPKNTELLSQKQTVLKENIKLTTEQVNNLKEAQRRYIESGGDLNTAEYRKLQREIINTQNKLSNLKNEASNWTKVGNSFIEWGNNLDKIASKIDNLGNKLTTRLTAPIAGIVGLGIKYNADMEKYTTAFETFLGDAKEAEKVVNDIKNDASKTPFDVTSLVKANQMLISTGENAGNARNTIMALGDAVVATGGGNDELTRMASNLQQIKNAGKATAMDIRQFAYAGIDVYGILADYLGKTTQEIKEMEISYDDLSAALQKASSQGGKYYGAMSKSSETLTGQVNQLKAQVKDMLGELTKSLMPIAKKIVAKAKELIQKFNKLSDSEKQNIVNIGLLVAAIGPLLKLLSSGITVVSGFAKGIGTVTKAVALAKNGIGDATGSAATLAKVFKGLTSPIGLVGIGITTTVGIITAELKKAEQKTRDTFSTMSEGAKEFFDGIDNAKSHLSDFNSELFVSSQEQQELQEQMQEVQNGITTICKTASEERRDYTQKEIEQLDEYFQKLRELNQRELELEKVIAGAITQQATQSLENSKGSLEEYKLTGQEWIKAAEEQKDKTISLIENQTIEEVALLNQRYGTEANMQNEAYATEYNIIEQQKQEKIQQANDEVAKINEVYSTGYLERSNLTDIYNQKVQEANERLQKENENHANIMENIEKKIYTDYLGQNNAKLDKQRDIENEERRHATRQKAIWKEMYENMSENELKQIASLMAMAANTEMYGGKVDDKTKEFVDMVLQDMDKMPSGAKSIMEETMNGMLKPMQEKQPVLFEKASGIANGILSKLKKSFDIHSPSKETRKIFENVMKGAELGLEDEEESLNKELDSITKNMQDRFNMLMPNMSAIKQSIIDKTQTIFTTPQIIFNVQELDQERLQQCFNYVNKKLGSAY